MRLTNVAFNFLKGKGIHVYEEEFTYIKLCEFEGNHFLLSHFVCYRYFLVEVCRQYKTWSSFFDKKRKCQFISLPFHVFDILIRGLTHLAETIELLDSFHLKEVEVVK
jgi:hypothetical protein